QSLGAEGFLYGLDVRLADPSIIAYQIGPTGGSRVSARDFSLPDNYDHVNIRSQNAREQAGLEIYNGFLYLVGEDTDDSDNLKVFVFELTSTGATRAATREWDLVAANDNPVCLAIYDDIAYVGDLDGTFYAYTITESGATRTSSRDWTFQNRRRLRTGRFQTFLEYAAGLEIDNNGLAYIVSASTTQENAFSYPYSDEDDGAIENGASNQGHIRVYEIVPTGAIRRASRDVALQSGRKTGIAITNGYIYVAEREAIEVYEHYPSPPNFPIDVGPSQTFVVNQDIIPFTIPGAGGFPAARYSITGLPNGVTFNATTRVVSGRPTATGQGTATVTADNRPES
ncbi:MAG: putative Ig domain-containing protein, partial [Rhodobacteraceae bacterium]|nr:putative Ig domain-containing protein [Paracoccaceae bacterium]